MIGEVIKAFLLETLELHRLTWKLLICSQYARCLKVHQVIFS